VKFAFIDVEKALWPIGVQCDVLGVSRSGYYAWKGRPEAERVTEDAELVVEIKAAHKTGRGAAWVTDVTYVWTLEGWLYLAVILDLFSRRVVGWSASANNDRALAFSALHRATTARAPAPGMVHHSDRGSVYASADYGDALTQLGAVKSMSRKGDCWDNAVAESFFATIKGEMIDHEDYPTRGAAIAAIANYIDAFYNPCRRHSALDYVSPIEFELKFMSEKIEKMAA
jgi:transposase InsO family protein